MQIQSCSGGGQMRLALTILLVVFAYPAWADKPFFLSQREFVSRDTLDIGKERVADAQDFLNELKWDNSEFKVHCRELAGAGDSLVSFASPVENGEPNIDLVTMEWFVARDDEMKPMSAPAVVVVHESGSAMTVGRLFAFGLSRYQLHAFLIHLPFYGERRARGEQPAAANIISLIRQGIADVRRARDAVSALPLVDESHIGLQGTSLGGFVAGTAAGLDKGYDSVFIVLAGGDVYDIIQHGKKDAAGIRRRLERDGFTGEKLKSLACSVEPLRLAHRLDAKRTWLYSGIHDTVIPLRNAVALASAAKLDEAHHIQLNANHYNGILYLPTMLDSIATRIKAIRQQEVRPTD